MKRKSYAELQSEAARLSRENALQCVAITLLANQHPDAIERLKEKDGSRHTLKLYGAERACGGIVIHTFYHSGQDPSSSAHYLDEMASWKDCQLQLRCAIEHLVVWRNRSLAAPDMRAQPGLNQ